MSEGEEFLKRLDEMVDQLKRLSVEQKVVGPKREEAVESLLTEAETFKHDLEDWRRRGEQDERLAQAIEAIGKSLGTAMKRLSVSEERLEYVERTLGDGNGREPDLDPEILEEANFLAAELAGLPTPAGQPQFLKDGRRPEAPSALDVLGSAIYRQSN